MTIICKIPKLKVSVLAKNKNLIYNKYIINRREYMDFDEIGFKDEIELMNLQKKMQQNQMQNSQAQTLEFNLDSLYNQIDNLTDK